jgi:hypothetical protein
LLRLWQQQRAIEIGVYWVRGAVLCEDAAPPRTGTAPWERAAFRNLALSLHRWRGSATHLGALFRRPGLAP